jgi:hypothetical protein
VQRICMDSMASRHAGRSIWGIPKVRQHCSNSSSS